MAPRVKFPFHVARNILVTFLMTSLQIGHRSSLLPHGEHEQACPHGWNTLSTGEVRQMAHRPELGESPSWSFLFSSLIRLSSLSSLSLSPVASSALL